MRNVLHLYEQSDHSEKFIVDIPALNQPLNYEIRPRTFKNKTAPWPERQLLIRMRLVTYYWRTHRRE